MTMVRQIALLFAVVIATIAVSLTPSSAQAHDGHAHGVVVASAHASTGTSSRTMRAISAIASMEAAVDCACPSCTAGGHHGSCCFSGGLAPAGLTASLPPMTSNPAPARDYAALAGIVPEALPEPPRTIA
ncbi:hypothetical protein [Methylobacterium gnaphalii]|uniref:hypothetical protein n=1 Tax=Methylobacterium gnaphalii TaxID=1010610 RepID=UPI0011BDCB47|nr:hypothetical protein [Methylobacterium gnaphalii]